MAVNELDRDYLKMVHNCDTILNIINNRKMTESPIEERKGQVGNIIMVLELELLDDKYTTAGKDLSYINETITQGRTYWQGED
tara:strand:- start:3881 stop:4129 length:249 start_codon:yes stop_codon:yes gene_type:complete